MSSNLATRTQWYRSDFLETIPLVQRYRNVLVLLNFHDYKDAIQTQCRSNTIDVTLQTPPEGKRWLNTIALFTIAELIGPEPLHVTKIENLWESLTERIFQTWHLPLAFSFFTLRLLDTDSQHHDLRYDASIYDVDVGVLPLPFDDGSTQPHILRLTAHHLD